MLVNSYLLATLFIQQQISKNMLDGKLGIIKEIMTPKKPPQVKTAASLKEIVMFFERELANENIKYFQF